MIIDGVRYISLGEYAVRGGSNRDNIRQKILRGTLPAVKSGGKWFLPENTPDNTDTRYKTH